MISFHQVESLSNGNLLFTFINKFLLLNPKTGAILAAPTSSATTSVKNKIDDALFPKTFIRDFSLSKNNMFATISEDKLISYWDLNSFSKVEELANAVKFTNDAKRLIIGDKFGDVYGIHVNNLKTDGIKLLNGHISMILDMVFSPDGDFIITAERDEKIKVSKFPNAYIIQGFCLGHKEYVSALDIPPFLPEILISGGGDQHLFSWSYKTTTKLDTFDFSTFLEKTENPLVQEQPESTPTSTTTITATTATSRLYYSVLKITSSTPTKTIAVAIEKQPFILLLALSTQGKFLLKQKLAVKKDVLNVAFDQEGNLWVCYGQTIFAGEYGNKVDVFRVGKDKKYMVADAADRGVVEVNKVDVGKVETMPDYYEISKFGKDVIMNKNFHGHGRLQTKEAKDEMVKQAMIKKQKKNK